MGTIDSNLTGYYLNLTPGLSRDPYGNVSGSWIQAFFGEGSNDPPTWLISWVGWSPQPSSLAFNRHVTNIHWVTTGYVPSGYRFEETLGYLLMAGPAGVFPYQSPGGGMQTLYGCVLTSFPTYQFVSLDPNCEGQIPGGSQGWIYSSQQSGTQALYRCRDGADHFVSPDPGCEGWVNEGLLGYAQTSP